MGRIITNLSFFSGVGGLDLGAKMCGIRTISYCEFDRYAQGVLRSRIADGGLDDGPIWDDVKSFDGKPWRGADIVSGGFPCQDVSVAGERAGVEEGTRSGLFYELMRVCREVEPRFILLENVAGLLIYPGAHRVFGELASMGYDAGWKIISASDVGANHGRQRIWIIANSQCRNVQKLEVQPATLHQEGREAPDRPLYVCNNGGWSAPPPRFLGLDDVVAYGVERIKRGGNGVVPQQSIPAWEEIKRLA